MRRRIRIGEEMTSLVQHAEVFEGCKSDEETHFAVSNRASLPAGIAHFVCRDLIVLIFQPTRRLAVGRRVIILRGVTEVFDLEHAGEIGRAGERLYCRYRADRGNGGDVHGRSSCRPYRLPAPEL